MATRPSTFGKPNAQQRKKDEVFRAVGYSVQEQESRNTVSVQMTDGKPKLLMPDKSFKRPFYGLAMAWDLDTADHLFEAVEHAAKRLKNLPDDEQYDISGKIGWVFVEAINWIGVQIHAEIAAPNITNQRAYTFCAEMPPAVARDFANAGRAAVARCRKKLAQYNAMSPEEKAEFGKSKKEKQAKAAVS